MKKYILLLFIALIMLNCKQEESQKVGINAGSEKVIIENKSLLDLGCYVFDDGKNVISLEILKNGKVIQGNLCYAFAEKDKNVGVFKGQLIKNILIGNYTFNSEGIETTREVAFKVNGNKILEGYGELNIEGTGFEDFNTIQFSSNMPLMKTDCK